MDINIPTRDIITKNFLFEAGTFSYVPFLGTMHTMAWFPSLTQLQVISLVFVYVVLNIGWFCQTPSHINPHAISGKKLTYDNHVKGLR